MSDSSCVRQANPIGQTLIVSHVRQPICQTIANLRPVLSVRQLMGICQTRVPTAQVQMSDRKITGSAFARQAERYVHLSDKEWNAFAR